MKINGKMVTAIAAGVVAVAGIMTAAVSAAGGSIDVVKSGSVAAFDKVLTTIPDQVAKDEKNGGWSLTAPDGSVRFIWSQDYSSSPLHDVMLEFDAKPFLDAGLDTGKLPENYASYEDMLMVGQKLGDDKLTYEGEPTALAAYEQIVHKYRNSLNYHTAMDHFGVKLGDGNMFEWAKNMETNTTTNETQDKDIVFVLNPEPLIAAGVNPEKVEGWTYGQVPVEENGRMVNVYKLLKPFNLQ